jgi:hypothetical protein
MGMTGRGGTPQFASTEKNDEVTTPKTTTPLNLHTIPQKNAYSAGLFKSSTGNMYFTKMDYAKPH